MPVLILFYRPLICSTRVVRTFLTVLKQLSCICFVEFSQNNVYKNICYRFSVFEVCCLNILLKQKCQIMVERKKKKLLTHAFVITLIILQNAPNSMCHMYICDRVGERGEAVSTYLVQTGDRNKRSNTFCRYKYIKVLGQVHTGCELLSPTRTVF